MKQNVKFFGLIAAMSLLVLVMSCGGDDGPKIKGGDGLLVADGFYPAKVGEDPTAVSQLVSEPLDGPDFGTLERDGFLQGYVYLTAGNYNVVEVEDGSIVNTYGGTASAVAGEAGVRNMECDENDSEFMLITPQVDGAAFSIPADGLYVVAFDQTLNEVTYDQITSAGVIGAATPGAWSTDTEMTGSVSATGGSWTVTELALEEGEWKVRFNCRWAIDRRIDASSGFANTNGYSYFTNFGGVGGSVDNLAPGNSGANFNNGTRGEYTVTLTWDPVIGFSITATKTGDLDPLPEFPEVMYLVGAATTYGWDEPGTHADAVMHKIAGSNPGVYWKILSLTGGQGFKVSAAGWGNPNLGFSGITADTEHGVAITDTEGNMAVANDGIYMVVLDLRTDGVSKLSVREAEVYGIGDTYGSWDGQQAATKYVADFANGKMTSPALTAAGDIRIYTYHPWISDWWHAEFVPMSGVIEYRNDGGDQARVAGVVGDVVTLYFDDNTATVGIPD